MSFVASFDANYNSATAIDVVSIDAGDAELIAFMTRNTSGEWFAQRDQILRAYSPGLRSKRLELAPGQTIEHAVSRKSDQGVYVFFNYLSPAGQQGINVVETGDVVFRLNKENIEVVFR